MPSALALILCIAALVLMVWVGANYSKIKGKMGETNVAVILGKLSKEHYCTYNDIIMPSKYGTTQIDHVVVSSFGIFVIETKNYKGLICGGENAEQWTKNMWGNKYKFRNPLKQNYGHVKALQAILNLPQSAFIPVVVFSNNADISVQTNQWVINMCNLREVIKLYRSEIFTQEQLIDFCERISNARDVEKGANKQHVQTVRSNVYHRNQSIANGICPQCGGRLVLRNGRYGSFYGCSNYPNCRFTIKD